MLTTDPTSAPPERPAGQPPNPPPDEDRGWGAGAAAVVVAVLALVLATIAVVFTGDDGGAGGRGGGAAAATVDLSEFALAPASVTVPAGGSLEVTNSGSTAHNLSVSGADIATADLAAGDSETLDLGDLAPGTYDLFCTIRATPTRA